MKIKQNPLKSDDFERRSFIVQMRAEESDGVKKLAGHAAVFGQEIRLFSDVFEIVERGAFTKTIKEGDARAFWNHNSDIVLGRVSNGTLRLREDEKGLATEITPPETGFIRDMAVAPIERGDVREMSFGFRVVKREVEEREDGSVLVRLKEVQLFEVSPVALPAYDGTDISARSREYIEDFRQQRHAAKKSEPETIHSEIKPQDAPLNEPERAHLENRYLSLLLAVRR